MGAWNGNAQWTRRKGYARITCDTRGGTGGCHGDHRKADWPSQAEEKVMVEETCPWCEATLAVASQPLATEETCPQCLTTWAYEMTEDREAAIAA
jgi:hypothetical protein